MAEANNKLGANGLVLGAQTPSEISSHDDAGTGKVLLYASGSGAGAKLYYKGGGTTQKPLGTDVEALPAFTGSLAEGDLFMVADQDKGEGNEAKITFGTISGSVYSNISGDITVGTNGVSAIGEDKVHGTMLNSDAADGSTLTLSSDSLSVLKVPNALSAGTGLSAAGSFDGATARTLSVGSAQTSIESILNTDFTKIGTAANEEYVDFGTLNEVNVHIGNTERLSVTAAGADVTGDLTVSGDLTVNGDLVQQNVSQLVVEDTLIGLGYGASATGSVGDRGLVMGLNGENAVAMIWDESESQFAFARTSTDNKASTATIAAYAPMKAAAIQGTSLSGSSTLDLDGAAQFNGNVTIKTGKTLDLTGVTITLDNDAISGDKVEGGTINATTITTLSATAVNSATLSGSSTLDVDGEAKLNGNVKVKALTSGRVVIAGANGLLSDDADLSFSGDTLTATKIGAFEAAGAINFANQTMTNVDIDSGDISGTDIVVGSGKSLTVSAGTLNTSTSQDLSIVKTGIGAMDADVDFGDFDVRAQTLTVDSVGATSILYAGTNGLISGSATGLNFNAASSLVTASGSVAVYARSAQDGLAFFQADQTRVAALNSGGLTILQGQSKVIDFGDFAGGAQAKIANGSGASMLNLSSSAGLHLQLNNAQHANNVITVNAGGNSSNQAIVVEGGKGIIAAFLDVNSDRELKKDIAPMSTSNLLDKVMSLEPVSYEMKWAPGTADLGFIAQDVAKIVPEVCRTDESGIARSIDYSRLTTILAGAVQEQQVQIDDLKEIIAKLQK